MSVMGEIKAITPDFVPTTPEEMAACLASWEWRMFSGQLYKIIVKEHDDDEEGVVLPFKPNRAQRRFLKRLHYRNVILKARQLGFTTLIAILFLDHAMFNADQRCGIIAHKLTDAETIFRDKVLFAYKNMPAAVRDSMPLKRESAEEILFAHNNSSIRVATSMRSGTIHRLHISELGKIAKENRKHAREIVTGSLPAVPKTAVAIIESTAEGQEGEFFNIASRAQRRFEAGEPPTLRQWSFHFFPWFEDEGYSIDPDAHPVSPSEHEYFDKVQAYWRDRGVHVTIEAGQRAWYVSQRDEEFSGDAEKMWQEYPSTPDECWQRSTEGTFYALQLSRARSEGRITRVPPVEGVRVNTFWDIGARDGTAIWLHQYVGMSHRFIGFIEDWDKGYAHFVRLLRETGYVFGGMFLPHDATHKRQQGDRIAAPIEMLQQLAPDWSFHIVPQVQVLQHGIDLTRQKFPEAWFDEERCKEGIIHLQEYRKRWNDRLGVWSDTPDKDNPHTEAADAFRQWAQGFDPSLVQAARRPSRRRSRSGGMAV